MLLGGGAMMRGYQEGDENINNGSQMILWRTHILGEDSQFYKRNVE